MSKEQPTTPVDEMRAILNEIAAFDVEKPCTDPNLGTVNFSQSRDELERAKQLGKDLTGLPLEIIPDRFLDQMKPLATNLRQALKSVQNFSIEAGDPANQRNQLVQQVTEHHAALLDNSVRWMGYLNAKSTDAQQNLRATNDMLREVRTLHSGAVDYADEKKQDVDRVVQATKDAAKKIGVAQFAPNFESEATAHDTAAGKWLKATVILAILTSVVAFLLLFGSDFPKGTPTPAIIQLFITKALILSVLYLLMIWAARNYRVHRHQHIVNKHRMNALQTFETFTNAAESEIAREAILLEATHCIFSHVASGYLASVAAEDGGPVKIVEILKAAGKSGKTG